MAESKNGSSAQIKSEGITKITVAGFKSINEECSIEVRPLTFLAGANSSGKSSMMQPLLLLKQTMEAPFDPPTLLLDGPNVKFTAANQLLSRGGAKAGTSFRVALATTEQTLSAEYRKNPDGGLGIKEMQYGIENVVLTLQPKMNHSDLETDLSSFFHARGGEAYWKRALEMFRVANAEFFVEKERCILNVVVRSPDKKFVYRDLIIELFGISQLIRGLIHLPGLRGNPERSYSVAAVGPNFRGTFENYVASILASWQSQKDSRLEAVCNDLQALRLSSRVSAKRIDDTQVEIQVGRQMDSGARDMVNVADVGFGVSQTLPVIVALHAAQPGQLVYVEQPEIHLHPRAQRVMATLLANAARRGVRVVAETHSSILLLGVQTMVAKGELSPELVKLHWFENDNGATKVTPAELDCAGRFGDWPMDFDDVHLRAESEYLDAAEEKLAKMGVA